MFFDEFCRSHSSYLLEISPSRRSLAISCIIEKFLNVGVLVKFKITRISMLCILCNGYTIK